MKVLEGSPILFDGRVKKLRILEEQLPFLNPFQPSPMFRQILTTDENFLALRRIRRIEKNSSIRECEGKGIFGFLEEYFDTRRIKQIVLKKKFQEFAIGLIGQKIAVSRYSQTTVFK